MGSKRRSGAYAKANFDCDDSWMDRAACAGLPPAERSDYFVDLTKGAAARRRELVAKMRCQECPVRAECLDFALASRTQGIWGGYTESERNGMIQRRSRAI